LKPELCGIDSGAGSLTLLSLEEDANCQQV
jgi:hypothetical protein